ncbi:MAG: hypothetical protein H6737_19770 [Alphaproteobacteria bacterium]|nr:hypothetical protein [Alphaproteobacteria bacterium]
MRGSPRHLLVPNANSPELLTRLLDMVGRGIRSTRGLSEALGVEARTVLYYTQAGEWLGLIDVDEDCELTPLGLEYVYAGEDRPRVYARAVWANPVVAELLAASDDRLPTVGAIAAAVRKIDPEMAPSTIRRRASAIRGLIAPAIGQPRARAPGEVRQMALPFGRTNPPPAPPDLEAVGTREYSPDAYRYLLANLLDHGELELHHVRGLLDRANAETAPIGGYVDMAIARGDARRIGKSIAITPAATQRAELVESTTSIILSDPVYRAYLEDCRLAPTDRHAALRRDQVARRFRGWDTRLLGHAVDPDTLDADLEAILLDRPLSAFPIAVPGARQGSTEPGAFLDRWADPDLLIACPPTLAQLQGGVAAVNRLLRAQRGSPEASRTPTLADVPQAVHGGMLHPGEVPPRAVPDTRMLRARVLANAPYVTLSAALLLTHRRHPHRLVVHRHHGRWTVRLGTRTLGPVLPLFDDFARARGWAVVRRAQGGLPDAALFDTLEALGIASTFGRQAVLNEKLFAQLRSAPEESELHARMAPLVGELEDWLGATT